MKDDKLVYYTHSYIQSDEKGVWRYWKNGRQTVAIKRIK